MVCVAKAGRRFDQRIKHLLQIESRAANDLEDLRGCRLLLQRLGMMLPSLSELAPVFFEFLFQFGVGFAIAANMSSCLRSRRPKTGNACSALRPFARQGYLVGTATGPPSEPSQGSSLSILTQPHDELAPPHLISSGKQRRRYGEAGSTHLLEAPGEHKVESAMQEVAIVLKTDRQRWFATGPRILGDIGIIPEIKLCGERHMQRLRNSKMNMCRSRQAGVF